MWGREWLNGNEFFMLEFTMFIARQKIINFFGKNSYEVGVASNMENEKMNLPNQRNIVLCNIPVGTDESHLFGNGSCYKQTIKRIAVYPRQRFKSRKIIGFDREDVKTIGFRKINETGDLTIKFQFSQTDFYCKFLCGAYTQMYLIGKIKNYFFGGFGKGFIAVEIPNRSVCIQQITIHLHIILEILKWCIKIIRHPKFTLCTAKSTPFTTFRDSFRCKGKNNRSSRYFAGYFNCQSMTGRYFYSLCNAHKENIA